MSGIVSARPNALALLVGSAAGLMSAGFCFSGSPRAVAGPAVADPGAASTASPPSPTTRDARAGGPAPVAVEPEDDVWVERERLLMGTVLRIRLAARHREEALRATEAAFGAVEQAEDLLSTWQSESALSRLNGSSPERAVSIPSVLARLLLTLREWTGRTQGAFDPTVGALLDAWDLRGEGRRPRPGVLRAAREASGWKHFEIEAGRAEGNEAGRSEVLENGRSEARRLHPDAWIDAGAFGKGLALQWAREALGRRDVESALLDFGGQVLALGGPPGGGACWRVAVAHPRQRHQTVEELRLCGRPGGPGSRPGASAATTSASERFLTVEADTLGHVLDPRSGRPVSPWGSVTVVRDDPLEADLLSTALFVMGPDTAREWARERGVAALLVKTEGGLLGQWMSPALRELLTGTVARDRHPAEPGATLRTPSRARTDSDPDGRDASNRRVGSGAPGRWPDSGHFPERIPAGR